MLSCASSTRVAPAATEVSSARPDPFPGAPAAALAGPATEGMAVAEASETSATTAGSAASPRPGQWLFRVEISGEEGSGSLRLMLRRLSADRFILSAADALGQARWEIRRERDAAVWSDPQGHLFCALDARLPLRARQWVPDFPLSDLPGLLTGEWPAASAVASAAPVAGTTGRRITGERGPDAWDSWTLWEDGEPVAWFKHLGADSLLSVRRPSVQVRWRVTAQGSLGPPGSAVGDNFLRPGELIASAREIACPENAIP